MSRPSHPLSMTTALCALLSGAPALAQESAQAVELPTITVLGDRSDYGATGAQTATRTDAKAIDVPQSTTTVTKAALEDRSATTIDEALATVSGVTQANTIAGRQDSVIRRGFGEAGDGSILTDGIRTVLPHSFNATVERADVLKGPASTLYGVLDPGGMVNLVTKKPQDTQRAQTYLRYDAYGAGRALTTAGVDMTGAIRDTNLSYRIIAERKDGDYWRNFGSVKQTTLAPSIRYEDAVQSVTLSYLYQNYDLPYERGTVYDTDAGAFVDVSRRTRLDEAFGRTTGEAQLAKLSYRRDLGGAWAFTFDYGYSQDSFSADQDRVLGYDSATGALTRRTDTRGYYHDRMHSARAELSGSEALWGLRNEFLLGATFDYEDLDRAGLQRCNRNSDFNINSLNYGETSACIYDAAADAGEYETVRTGSVYLQDRLHLSQKLTAVAGARLQYYDITAGVGDSLNTDAEGHELLPNLGLVYRLSDWASVYANASKSFRPNASINSAYGDLDPETGISYEIGAKLDLADRLTGTLALYTADKKNVAFSDTVDGDTVYRTAGLVRARGVELDVAGQLTDRLSLIGSYAFTNAKVIDDPDYAGKRLPNVAMQTTALYLSYDHGDVFGGRGSLRYGGGIRGVSARPGDADNSFELPGYGLVDLFASYRFETANPVTVQLNLNNIFDRTYYTSSIGNSAYGVAVGQPFNASLKLSMEF